MSITLGSTSVLGRAPMGLCYLLVVACTPEDPQKGRTEQVNVPVVSGGERIANRPTTLMPPPPPDGARAFPEGALVRRDCGGTVDTGFGRLGTSSGYGSGGGGNRVRPSSAPKPRAMPTKTAAGRERANTPPADGAPAAVAAAPPAPAPAPVPGGLLADAGPMPTGAPAQPMATEQLEAAPVGVGDAPTLPAAEPAMTGGAVAPEADANKESRRAATVGEKKDKSEPMASRSRTQEEYAKAAPPPPTPVLDWGATVYLSNDDSMSLASAQRLLWAIDRGHSFGPGEVRPHELLNYFTFDTVPVSPGSTFSVLGSAEQQGDTLSVALAVQGAWPTRDPLDLTLVVDKSGSMWAEGRMDYVQRGLLQMVGQLVPGDRVDLVLFDSNVCTPLENFVVGRDDEAVLEQEIRKIRPNSATNLVGGLRDAYRIQTARNRASVADRNRRIVLLTDAFLNEGMVDQDLVAEVGRRFEEDGIRLTGVGVGREFNDSLLNKLTEKSKGSYVYLGSEAVVDRVFGAGFLSLIQTIAHNVQFSIHLPPELAMTRFYGEESSTNAAEVQPIHYFAGTRQLFLQDLKMRPGAVPSTAPIRFEARFEDAKTGETRTESFTTTVGELLAGEVHNLHKAQALMRWSDLLLERAMGDRSCRNAAAWEQAAAKVSDDAEIAYVGGLTQRLCPTTGQNLVAAPAGLKVKISSDIIIPEVQLICGGQRWTEALSGSDSVANFGSAPSGACELVFQGTVPMRARVQVPPGGVAVACNLRGGRVFCS